MIGVRGLEPLSISTVIPGLANGENPEPTTSRDAIAMSAADVGSGFRSAAPE